MIHGERTTLRPYAPDDASYIVSWTLDPEVQSLIEGDYPRTPEAARRWAASIAANRHKRYFVIEDENGRPIGDIELDHIAWRSGEAELRIRIGEKTLWNRGYGTDAIRSLLRHAFTEMRMRRIYLRVFGDNRRAINCYRKCGFRVEGTLVRGGRRPGDAPPRKVFLMEILASDYALTASAARDDARRASAPSPVMARRAV